MNMSKSGESVYFCHVFVKKNFLLHFFKTFSMDLKSKQNSAFFDTFFDFFQKMFFRSYSTFSNFEAKCAKHGTKNQKTY